MDRVNTWTKTSTTLGLIFEKTMFKTGVLFHFGNEHGFITKKCCVSSGFRVLKMRIAPNRRK